MLSHIATMQHQHVAELPSVLHSKEQDQVQPARLSLSPVASYTLIAAVCCCCCCPSLQIGAHAMAVCETLACRISAHGGAALLIDYGQNCPYQNSLTAIRGHEGVHPLSQPGTADISAWVDFSAMRMAAEEALEVQQASQVADSRSAAASGTASAVGAAAAGYGVDVYGPVDQADLLHRLGIQARLQALAQAASPQQIEALVQGYHRLVDKGAGGMGASYKALAIVNKGVKAPIGFGVQEQ
eukprot:GHRR01020349.1.p1 GENE.GHRR01020349.1~~GHRR01020349.1.p1  ORF type:complete len:241 (+),score=78.13 GHRR01020349.1:408-1130(+)